MIQPRMHLISELMVVQAQVVSLETLQVVCLIQFRLKETFKTGVMMRLGQVTMDLKIVASTGKLAVTRDSTRHRLLFLIKGGHQETGSIKISLTNRCNVAKNWSKFFPHRSLIRSTSKIYSIHSHGQRTMRGRQMSSAVLSKVRTRAVSLTRSMKNFLKICTEEIKQNTMLIIVITVRSYERLVLVSKWYQTP